MEMFKCKNKNCKHCTLDGVCKKESIQHDSSGSCTAFEKGFLYYTNLVRESLSNSNFIPAEMADEDMKLGMYYIMRMFHLGFAINTYGFSTFFTLYQQDDDQKKALSYKEISKLQLDESILAQDYSDFLNGIMPNAKVEEKAPVEEKEQPFGWLSPMGDFTPGDFGEHEKVAFQLIEQLNLKDEFLQQNKQGLLVARDFLSARGWCLIHNPTGMGGYIVSHEKPLTRKQNEFLFGYFVDMGDTLTAQHYV